ncbi:MAG TPA: hypothetical protein VJH23_03450 [archaeon]|nr:hypothetical protein [archaeon]
MKNFGLALVFVLILSALIAGNWNSTGKAVLDDSSAVLLVDTPHFYNICILLAVSLVIVAWRYNDIAIKAGV